MKKVQFTFNYIHTPKEDKSEKEILNQLMEQMVQKVLSKYQYTI